MTVHSGDTRNLTTKSISNGDLFDWRGGDKLGEVPGTRGSRAGQLHPVSHLLVC